MAARAEAPWQRAENAPWSLTPATLGLALALSVVLHALALTIERKARTPGGDATRFTATLRVAAQQTAPPASPIESAGASASTSAESATPKPGGDQAFSSTANETMERPPDRQPKPAAIPEAPSSASATPGADAWLGLDTPQPVPLPRFDADSYLPPSQVQSAAEPYDEDLFDNLPLSGHMPGRWLARLFIGEHGRIDRIDIVEASGAPHNEEELRRALEAALFRPARNGQEAVRSQRTLVFSFDPPPVPPPGRPGPSASGK